MPKNQTNQQTPETVPNQNDTEFASETAFSTDTTTAAQTTPANNVVNANATQDTEFANETNNPTGVISASEGLDRTPVSQQPVNDPTQTENDK